MEGDRWDAEQIERVVRRMAHDARFHVIAWHAPLIGRDAIRDELTRQASNMRDLRIEVVGIASDGRTVFTERLDSMTLRDRPATIHIAGVFEVDEAGEITRWSDYIDSREVAARMKPDV